MLLTVKNNQRRLVQQIVSQFRGHLFITTLRTSPPALLHLLHCNGFRSIRAGLMAVAYDIRRMLGWVGIRPMETG
ncbi:hypothetical protein KBZ14_14535 [Synechococcus sp. HJ21-Hayes]|uniref:hypothetical protein n=1 Tax=unclassified Synechococcus TaxID=2626047 RepID=UPI0020CE574A|nr:MULTISPECIES: hypothetical protein [unclassified Synechococcus]MCP9832429.1 hypothetical protein [Synechococcus sp. JJ3a-Johnson]MCP9854074.1 hypothetical protein [Synechococcus sp. HJ21-Hayes]